MKFLLLLLVSFPTYAGMLRNPDYEVVFFHCAKDQLHYKRLSWNDLDKKDTVIELRKGPVGYRINAKATPDTISVKMGRVTDPPHPKKQYTGSFNLSDSTHSANAKSGGGRASNFYLLMVPKNTPINELVKDCEFKAPTVELEELK